MHHKIIIIIIIIITISFIIIIIIVIIIVIIIIIIVIPLTIITVNIDFNINIVENQSPSVVSLNDQHTLQQPDRLVTDHDEQMQRNKNSGNNEVQCHCGKLCKGDRGLRASQRFCQISDDSELR